MVSVGGSVGGSVWEPFSALSCLLADLLAGLLESCFQRLEGLFVGSVCRVCLSGLFRKPFSGLSCLLACLACLMAGLFDGRFQRNRVCWSVCLRAVFTVIVSVGGSV